MTPLPNKEETQQANPPSEPFPSAPSGHLPASGATLGEREHHDDASGGSSEAPDGSELAEACGRVLDSLASQRSKLGLTTPEPSIADRNAVVGLYRRLVEAGEQWPTVAMTKAIAFAMGYGWWPKRIRTGRQLARHWDELADDMTLDAQTGSSGETDAGMAEAAVHTHDAKCGHVRRIIDSADARRIEPVQANRLTFADQVADELNHRADDPHADYYAAILLRDLLTARRNRERDARAKAEAERRAGHEAMMRDLRQRREANGGSMFDGARP